MRYVVSLFVGLLGFVLGYGTGVGAAPADPPATVATATTAASHASGLIWEDRGGAVRVTNTSSDVFLVAGWSHEAWLGADPELGIQGLIQVEVDDGVLDIPLGGIDELTAFRLEPVARWKGGVSHPCHDFLECDWFPPPPPPPKASCALLRSKGMLGSPAGWADPVAPADLAPGRREGRPGIR